MTERDFYRLPDLAARWGCTVDDLLHLGIQHRAQVCVNIYGMASGISRTRMETEAPEPEPDDAPLTDDERREADAIEAAFERWQARTTKDMPHGVFELMHDTLRFLDMPDAFPHELHEARKFDDGWQECEFDPPVAINLDHLCMLHEEVARLNREVFGAPPKSEKMNTRERDSLLRILYGMACAAPYRYDPTEARNEATATIASATAAAGCEVDADTVRKYLKEAAERFGSARPVGR